MAEKKTKPPCWGYRAKGGGVESRLFNDGVKPKGWVDTPAKVKNVNNK